MEQYYKSKEKKIILPISECKTKSYKERNVGKIQRITELKSFWLQTRLPRHLIMKMNCNLIPAGVEIRSSHRAWTSGRDSCPKFINPVEKNHKSKRISPWKIHGFLKFFSFMKQNSLFPKKLPVFMQCWKIS